MRFRFIGAVLCACALPVGAIAGSMEDMLDAANQQLASTAADFRIGYAEYITVGESGAVGRTVFAKDVGNKQLIFDWVPGDPRRTWNAGWPMADTDLSVIVDGVDVTKNSHPNNTLAPGADLAAYHTVNQTWNAVQCSDIELQDFGAVPFDIGFVQWLVGFGGIPGVLTDLSHAGMLSPDFFDAIACGAPGSGCGANIAGVTFTFGWSEDGDFTDVDRNGRFDTAIREIYYNENFPWQDNPNDTLGDGSIDLESIALHEMGHGLSQAHFGTVGWVDRNRDGLLQIKEIQVAPQAVMNAIHTEAGRTISGTDMGGHCSNWAEWPNN